MYFNRGVNFGKWQATFFRLIFAILGNVKAKKEILSLGKTNYLHVGAMIVIYNILLMHIGKCLFTIFKIFIFVKLI